MRRAELERIIKQAKGNGKLTDFTDLDVSHSYMTSLPNNIGDLLYLTNLRSVFTPLASLPESIDRLSNLTTLTIRFNKLTRLPDSLCNLKNLTYLELAVSPNLTSLPANVGHLTSLVELHLNDNQLHILPESVCLMSNLKILDLSNNNLLDYPESIYDLLSLTWLNLSGNQLASLPSSICCLSQLTYLGLSGNQLIDLSILSSLPSLRDVRFLGVELPHRYWTKFSEWRSEWLLDENNAEIRRRLIEQLGYEQICEDLSAERLDTWREYTLLRINGVEVVYDRDTERQIDREPMVLLKMTCPSTAHIHILRVPPDLTSAEAAITWVNHGIHPARFAIQT